MRKETKSGSGRQFFEILPFKGRKQLTIEMEWRVFLLNVILLHGDRERLLKVKIK
jgi:hypothetical protein